ncbi:hypothetical protein P8839_08145 [Bacillus spizizenii]|nr:hypothetical protein [Bacillus spizizenii]
MGLMMEFNSAPIISIYRDSFIVGVTGYVYHKRSETEATREGFKRGYLNFFAFESLLSVIK